MQTMPQVRDLVRDLSGSKVLSVYLETRVTDPARRAAWRPALTAALRELAATLSGDDHAEFLRAAAHLDDAVLPEGGAWGAPGWMALATANDVQFTDELPVRTPTRAVWREGPVIAPYIRAMKQHHPVIVALVDSRSAMLFHYAWGRLDTLPVMHITANAPGAGEPSRYSVRGKSIALPRGSTGTERAARRREASFHRLCILLGERLADLAGDRSWILLGGTPVRARQAASALPASLAARTQVSPALSLDATRDEIAVAAKHAGSALRAARASALLDTVIDAAGAERLAVRGVPATQRALRTSAVDLLFLSPTFLFNEPDEAERSVHAALEHGAHVEVLSGAAAHRLDDEAEGIAGRLRYPLDLEPVPAA